MKGIKKFIPAKLFLDKLTEAIEALSVTFDTREILVNTSADLETQIRSVFNTGLAKNIVIHLILHIKFFRRTMEIFSVDKYPGVLGG